MKGFQWLVVIGALVFMMAYFSYSQITGLEDNYGVKFNADRIHLHVPVIDSTMSRDYAADFFFATHWITKDISSNEVTHVYKTITHFAVLNKVEEKDVYRMPEKNDQHYELYIHSSIKNKSECIRTGLLHLISSDFKSTASLNEVKIDSVAAAWNLNYLVRK